jgi:putative acetyltransferase
MVSLSPVLLDNDVLIDMPLREVRPDDVPFLADLYRASARELAARLYSAEQIAAWTSFPDDSAEFSRRVQRGVAIVSVVDGAIAAFGQLDPVDHVALLYTAPRFARQGHATAICRYLETTARGRGVMRLHTTASLLSRPLFEREGYSLLETEHTVYKGVAFERFKMEKRLHAAD